MRMQNPVVLPPGMKPETAILKGVLFLLKEDRWTKRAYGRKGHDGQNLHWTNKDADCFCLVGMIRRSGLELNLRQEDRERACLIVRREIGPTVSVEYWNDQKSRIKEDVIRVVQKALKATLK